MTEKLRGTKMPYECLALNFETLMDDYLNMKKTSFFWERECKIAFLKLDNIKKDFIDCDEYPPLTKWWKDYKA